MHELLTPAEMAEADRLAIAAGPFDGAELMARAGAAVADALLARFPAAEPVHVVCGPGNNGGDGYVVARLLAARGVAVRLWREDVPRAGSDAAAAAARCPLDAEPLADFAPAPGAVVVDALFGAGLSKPLAGRYAAAVERMAGTRVVAVDLPSGLDGARGTVLGAAAQAALTVTFFRKKPGHLLYPGRALCGAVLVADIGIADHVLPAVAPTAFENGPALWRAALPWPAADTHKYRRGHVAVLSGGPDATGAARLAARGAARGGAGAVTVLSPPEALLVNACQLTAIMVKRLDGRDDLTAFRAARRAEAWVLGPGFGVGETARVYAETLLAPPAAAGRQTLVLDADGITAFRDAPERLFEAARAAQAAALVLTPHAGEFARLFGDLAGDAALGKLERARLAAARAGAVVLLKGPDTVVAAPDGRAAINANGTPWLATAGAGDVLAGLIAALAAQGMPAFEAAAAAAWLHAETAQGGGPGLIAEDLPERLPAVLGRLMPAA
ncbi:NAD(P)H-hydrate dehydratase [Aquibium sp. A9E412]|uniref:NAD(P)H-hydrate dehydratase n=1 Tax=Aquibium sp. A9E412 TaxID=2976767 RepID=UPI0025B08D65|nr:NAD(P)H-hydrate dehydratase [Aquibium sp. A9E412]MDN2567458.1 NAD(P)H-hydrate dehydratase [Aquibium sp. A9E412]